MKLAAFLVKAKKATYASGNRAQKLTDGFEMFTFEEGDYTYQDKYRAQDPNPFGGEEVVWHKGKAIWLMNYYGFILAPVLHSDLYAFLRKAMSLLTEDAPFRGPASLKEGDFEYVNAVSGTVDNFKGTEVIRFKGTNVYRLEYHGGSL